MSGGRSPFDPVVTAVVGLGGYAGRIIDRLLVAEVGADHPPLLAAVTSSHPELHKDLALRLERHGVEICASYEALLAREDVEAVWLPVPIDLHLRFVEQALEAGKAVMCEKPVAGTVDECDRMIESRDRSHLPVFIGYQSIYDPATLWLKRRIVAGALGRINAATLQAVWPRDRAYYERTDWAGRLRRNEGWVLDSPLQNALNHFPNLALFLLGPTVEASAVPVSVESELYRTYEIQNYDTLSLRLTVEGGATILVLLTHAGRERCDPVIRFRGERGTATWRFDRDLTLRPTGGRGETIDVLDVSAQRDAMISAFNRRVRGTPDPKRMAATLEHARATLVAVNGASEVAPIHRIPAAYYETVVSEGGAELRAITGIEETFERCAQREQMLHASGEMAWTVAGRAKDLTGYDFFGGPFEANGG